ncbi:hypothetical protein [Aestuariispira insulae]|uniref:Uncharacterized protein n=1 Tax=Aestuariispira insulae TaxID=1461337 RepID=A0A3D9HGG8_9PROT|nr:hypothetical protein [Aestuariispira insulae]RED48554.1 hypothetical protein DFP90_10757 [Aestuariispira insulae]
MHSDGQRPNDGVGLFWVCAAWAAFLVLGHARLRAHHQDLSDAYSVGVALLIEIGLLLAGVFLVMLVVRKPRLTPRSALIAAVWIILVVVGHYLAFVEKMNAEQILAMMNLDKGWGSLLLVSLLYALLIAIPFVPGLELGLAIIMLFDWQGLVLVYFSTLFGLVLAFMVGRLTPVPSSLAAYEAGQKQLFGRLAPLLIRYRYLAVALLLNMPGNSVLGGGGGIALACGVSRRCSWPGFLLTIILATAPVPVMLWFGVISLDQLLGPHP